MFFSFSFLFYIFFFFAKIMFFSFSSFYFKLLQILILNVKWKSNSVKLTLIKAHGRDCDFWDYKPGHSPLQNLFIQLLTD